MRTLALLLLPAAYALRLPAPVSPRATAGTSALTQLSNGLAATLAAAAAVSAAAIVRSLRPLVELPHAVVAAHLREQGLE